MRGKAIRNDLIRFSVLFRVVLRATTDIFIFLTFKPCDTIHRFFHFTEGVPAEFDWLFPDPAERVPGAQAKQIMAQATWLRLYVAERLNHSGLPLDPGSLSPPR